jgi:uncharacterized protein YidB (DUF937 family)
MAAKEGMSARPSSLVGGEQTSAFSAPNDRRIACAVTDVLLEGYQSLPAMSLDELAQLFEKAGLSSQFDSWITRHENAYVSPSQIASIFDPQIVDHLAEQTGISKREVLDRLKSVLPKVIEQATPFGGRPSERTFRFHLQALRKRLA